MLVEEKELAKEGMREIFICQDGNLIFNIVKENLLLGFSHSYAGFLLKDSKQMVQVNQNVVKI
jgi:hypothetical protein